MTYKVVFMNLKHGATINVHPIICIGSPIIAPILSTEIWSDRCGGGRAFYSLVYTYIYIGGGRVFYSLLIVYIYVYIYKFSLRSGMSYDERGV